MTAKAKPPALSPIALSVIWHMHQPYYRKAGQDELVMPWVRLHAIKDYYDMAQLAELYPHVPQTFNLVPSLLEQLLGYVDGRYTDRYLRLSRLSPEALTEEEKWFIIERFFDAQTQRMVLPYPRYRELFDLRGGPVAARNAQRLFGEHELRDLQVWFNLAWFDPLWKETPGDLCHTLIAKGRLFSEEEKHALLDKQLEIMREVVPLHRRLQDEGRIEISTTPYYHPILPLLCDTHEARVAVPDIELPARRFQHPEDARKQVEMAVDYYTALFGRPPLGMWPAEGSVSPAVLAIFADAKIEWIATDEDILAKTLDIAVQRDAYGHVQNPDLLYRPYVAREGSARVNIQFRDRLLSDNIGFRYQHMDADKAVHDFMHRLETIARRCEGRFDRPPLVSVILDGENCWEFYPRDGRDFLELLHQALTQAPWVRPVTPSRYYADYGAGPELPRLFSGSWIAHNFRVWIGHREDNAAWDMLAELRDAVAGAEAAGLHDPQALAAAWQQVYVAEGSDWCWWYGDDRSSGQDDLWDQLYREHVAHGYEVLGLEPPSSVREPIAAAARRRGEELESPRRMIAPQLDGRDSHFFEWYGAARYRPGQISGAMQAADTVFDAVYAGFDERRFCLRVDFKQPARDILGDGAALHITFSEDATGRFSIACASGGIKASRIDADGPAPEEQLVAAVDEVVEIAIPWERLGVAPGKRAGFALSLMRGETQIDACPQGPTLKLAAPDEEFPLRTWSI